MARDIGATAPAVVQRTRRRRAQHAACGSRRPTRSRTPRATSTCSAGPARRCRRARGSTTSTYTFRLLSGAYKTTYNVDAGPNPENSVVSTPCVHPPLRDRWLDDAAVIKAGASTRVDIVDRHKAMFAPGRLRAHRGHVRQRRRRVHREHRRTGPRDPQLHRREQRPVHRAHAHLLRPARGHRHRPARARDPRRHGLLGLQPGRVGHALHERPQPRGRRGRRRPRHGGERCARCGRRSTARRAR